MSGDSDWKSKETIYDFSAKDIDGNDVSMEKYKGHPLLVVNVATHCGLTKANYKQLNELYDQFEEKGLKIAAFPCNQFGGQEPGCDVEIKEFIKKNGVRFDMFAKIDVNGDSAHPMYKWLKAKQHGFLGFDGIKWNFTKFLVNKEGRAIKRYAPTVEPKNIEPDIVNIL
ncbi:phospholipid hydroperoxide glutathione peroxidase [Dermatophagoides farinae]|uniref:Glutathione peroxidase n=1 Tax=Dermatophagoides farinae TaxID=6954 RepID=A0A9D4SCQ9_DERFA|nr:phospholipid hydroperoxide glutathione peroxidase [Dermatophagoides farinae]